MILLHVDCYLATRTYICKVDADPLDQYLRLYRPTSDNGETGVSGKVMKSIC